MPPMSRLHLCACLAAGLGVLGSSPAARRDDPPAVTLVPGAPTHVTLTEGRGLCRIEVPDDVTGLSLTTASSDGDVALYVALERPPDFGYGDYDVASANNWFEESLFIEVSDAYPLQPGAWYIAIESLGSASRTTLTAELVRPAAHTATVGEVAAFDLTRAHGLRARVEVALKPAPGERGKGKMRWLVEVECPLADVDVGVVASGLLSHLEAPYGGSQDLYGYERFVVEVPRFRGRIALDVFGYQESEPAAQLPVRVLVQRFEPPEHVPALDLCPEPRLPDAAQPLAAAPFDAAARATVVVVGPSSAGSGVIVTEDGLVLTCAHILAGADRPARDGILSDPPRPRVALGFTLDPSTPPAPAFGAEVVELREDLDLALVRITGDLLGRPLAERLGEAPRFPALAPAPRRPLMAERLFGFGYPVTGGSSTLVSLTMTNGVCAGYARELEGVLLKTDAEIHSGDSGGPFVDDAGQLVGIAISSLADADKGGGIGFVVPLELVPVAWRARLGWPAR